jgi:beta-lactamase regulating signal transducer with metallopeptidase domain
MSYAFLFEMGWKSAIIAGATLLLLALLRRRPAAERGAVLRVGVAALILLPLVAVAAPALVVETPAAAPAAPAIDLAAYLTDAQSETALSDPQGGNWDDPSILFLFLYLGGVAMVGGRLVGGLWTLRRWTKDAREVEAPEWREALAEVGVDKNVRLLVCIEADAPLSWGWRRPAILISTDALDRPEDARAIIAHEAAHIARRDWPALILSRLALTLFWFNPLVWRLDREVAQQAEEAADSEVAEMVEPALYAQTLLDWARQSGPAMLPANSMTGMESGMIRRVKAVLDGRNARRAGRHSTIFAMAACAAVAAPVAALEFVPEPPEAPAQPSPAPAAPAALPTSPDAPEVPPAPLGAPMAPRAFAAEAPPMPPVPMGVLTPPSPPSAPRVSAPSAPPYPPAPPVYRSYVRTAALAHPAVPPRPVGPDARKLKQQIDAAVAQAMRAHSTAAEAHRRARLSMEHAAAGMERGAAGMENGADGMDREARRLRSREYRERQIAEAAARGERVTHAQLLRAAEDMEEGARDMREGARDMRESARDMRSGDQG